MMKKWLFSIGLWLSACLTMSAQTFVSESQMQHDLLQMLADFTQYMKADYQACVEPNSVGEACGCFRSNNTMRSNEDGVRSNADMSMVCAFLCRYAKGRVVLPQGVTWDDIELMARHSLVFAYSTHKANRLKACADRRYWGSTNRRDRVWESSLWAMSVAYSAWFQWDNLTKQQHTYIYNLLRAECQYELERDIPTGYRGDTKAEENGWEACVLAATLGLFPDDELAPQWFDRMRAFAVNSYSHKRDAHNRTIIDPDRDTVRVCDLYHGPNLYDDYTLQNHDYFHTSYQNSVIQELGEAAIALRLFQGEQQRWHSRSLVHHNREVCDSVLYWLALSDGELTMPNGNDWSLFLYDQITSYSTMACLMRDSDALLLENRAYQMIAHRQKTTGDGSWLLRSDIGARRMGVQAHRVMMTWLLHHLWPTADLQPATWDDFRQRYSRAKYFNSQNIVRASTPSRFTCFSWSQGLKSYTGYIVPHTPDDQPFDPSAQNLIVPYKAHNTGNLLGWYDVEGCKTNAVAVTDGTYRLQGDAWVMNGRLLCNDSALDHRFAIYSTPGNAVVYVDEVRARRDVTVLRERGGLLAVSTDECTKLRRELYHGMNIDNVFGFVARPAGMAAFGQRQECNSVMTTPLYIFCSDSVRHYRPGDVVGRRQVVYYSHTDTTTTRQLSQQLTELTAPEGWRATVCSDPDGTVYLLVTNFSGADTAHVSGYIPQLRRRYSIDLSLPQGHSHTAIL